MNCWWQILQWVTSGWQFELKNALNDGTLTTRYEWMYYFAVQLHQTKKEVWSTTWTYRINNTYKLQYLTKVKPNCFFIIYNGSTIKRRILFGRCCQYSRKQFSYKLPLIAHRWFKAQTQTLPIDIEPNSYINQFVTNSLLLQINKLPTCLTKRNIRKYINSSEQMI